MKECDSMEQDKTAVRENVKEAEVIPYSLDINIQGEIASFRVEKKLNDYIGVQKVILPELEKQGFFREMVNEESGMVIEITRKGVKETLGNGKRFQSLPKVLKELKIATIRSLPEMIRMAHLVQDKVQNSHGNSPEYAYFMIEVDINGVNFNVRINVQKTSSKNKFWLHIVDITEKNSQLLSPSQTRP